MHVPHVSADHDLVPCHFVPTHLVAVDHVPADGDIAVNVATHGHSTRAGRHGVLSHRRGPGASDGDYRQAAAQLGHLTAQRL